MTRPVHVPLAQGSTLRAWQTRTQMLQGRLRMLRRRRRMLRRRRRRAFRRGGRSPNFTGHPLRSGLRLILEQQERKAEILRLSTSEQHEGGLKTTSFCSQPTHQLPDPLLSVLN
jgi:hypothetical protein